MYFDQGNSNRREQWLHAYKGSELLPAAKKLRKEFQAKEREARERVAKLISDMNIGREDGRIRQAKVDIEHYGREHEACAVLSHEFAWNPDKEFSLSLGDVVYFGLHS